MKKMIVSGIEHAGYLVKDLDAAMAHFKDMYGIENYAIYNFKPTRAWSHGKEVSNYHLKIAMASMSNGSGFELIEHVSGDGVHHDWVAQGNHGLHHLAFYADNFESCREYCISKGARFVFESETEDEIIGYRRCFYAEDPEYGMIYEIKEKPYFRT